LEANELELLLDVEIKGERHLLLVVMGASLSVMKPGVSRSEIHRTQTAATGNRLKAVGIQGIMFRVGKTLIGTSF
jgi:hypothetical protein